MGDTRQERFDIDIPTGVDPIEATVSPSPVQVTQPGEVQMITTTIENAATTDWFRGSGRGRYAAPSRPFLALSAAEYPPSELRNSRSVSAFRFWKG